MLNADTFRIKPLMILVSVRRTHLSSDMPLRLHDLSTLQMMLPNVDPLGGDNRSVIIHFTELSFDRLNSLQVPHRHSAFWCQVLHLYFVFDYLDICKKMVRISVFEVRGVCFAELC